MSNQEDIIYRVHLMDVETLLDLIIENPFFLTEAYYNDIRKAIVVRHAQLNSSLDASCPL